MVHGAWSLYSRTTYVPPLMQHRCRGRARLLHDPHEPRRRRGREGHARNMFQSHVLARMAFLWAFLPRSSKTSRMMHRLARPN